MVFMFKARVQGRPSAFCCALPETKESGNNFKNSTKCLKKLLVIGFIPCDLETRSKVALLHYMLSEAKFILCVGDPSLGEN
jgi:hypothetical protein